MDRSTPRPRRVRLSLAVAVFLGVATLAVSARQPADAQTPAHPHAAAAGTTASELALRNSMRMLWEQHVAWTRLAIVSFAGDLPDLAATQQRLLQNQAHIGKAIVPFYGPEAGKRLTWLLRRHIVIAVEILVDAKSGNDEALAKDLKRWDRNANQIASFLHGANPDNWPLREMRQMMHRHLRLTTQEAVAQLTGDYAAGVRAYDGAEREILAMADMLSMGIVLQFPDRFE
ncbi:MAG: hypothetical protein QOJ13_2630 [Gaiellales bacterium]|nr:hypothetical protein [Gaiellales bacterium]